MEIETLKIDIAFPDYRAEQLRQMLLNGWIIKDKTVMNERYIFYVLQKQSNTNSNIKII